jgi:hypothetical protein
MIRLYTFLIFVAIFVVSLYAIFVMPRPEFVDKTSLLFVAENTTTATNLNYIINDIVYISQNVVNNNAELQNNNVKVDVKRISEHNIIEIKIFTDSLEYIDTLEYDVIKEITKNIKKHYVLDKDLTVTIVAKSNATQTTIARIAPYVVMIMVAVGIIAGILVLFALFEQRREDTEYDDNIDGQKIFAHYNNLQFFNNKEQGSGLDDEENDDLLCEETVNNDNSLEDENNITLNEDVVVEENSNKEGQQKKEEIIQEQQEVSKTTIEKQEIVEDEEFLGKTPHIAGGSPQEEIQKDTQNNDMDNASVTPAGLQTTPGNLPVINLDEIGFGGDSTKNEDVCTDVNNDDEPTEEELKARLNDLLSGKL